MKLKKLKTGMVMALTIIAIGTSLINVSAMELNRSEEFEIKYSEMKKEFQEEYGKEDEFKVVLDDEFTKEEVNGAKGIIKTTNKMNNEVVVLNYFDEMKSGIEFELKPKAEKNAILRAEFQQGYGKEDKFKVVLDDEFTKEEVNGAKGIIKTTDKETGEVIVYNYFDELEK
ncbi:MULTISPECIES: hypothetical protein [unclassified Clostridioides]|uniref:hypothetical protein n=1 Tax=unclassified Clostridioides TaxID=2635829 RepID=UPI001D0FF878|nr:hypothetical protein [Clostridioides sp. ZZV14-6150]MCC0661438.1 hypothetical protein [Clostridioides sp. ZZV14-6154]MCC0668682.1 hypothetical protein [Clostridioides sp. ZZV14-6153]MCC0717936.1 hypothetical protein [Clostridioides sp. ZZV14-6105]MCC0721978.1 hypothetical protein [Clostridioides sp. ZZV14-6104]MCC0725997.1 hypothetical protein [Clostridioides sp. ZZV14-6045]MCC0731828.1 hypothetical protein [Clostridioides sp. ZZV14-6048]MCC0735156.1 hypothetical protein [Clostridioides s